MLSTGLYAQPGDSIFTTAPKKVLFPSPAAGGGRRAFLFIHVCVHVLTLILLIAMLGEIGGKLQDDNVNGTHEALVFSLIFHVAGVVLILGVSIASRKPFAWALVNAAMVWCFMASAFLFVLSLVGAHGAIAADHAARGTAIVTLVSLSAGMSFVFSGMAAGLAASAVSPEAAAKIAEATVSSKMGATGMPQMQVQGTPPY
jgi:predicted ferric reductase